jgi:hypothetical protein
MTDPLCSHSDGAELDNCVGGGNAAWSFLAAFDLRDVLYDSVGKHRLSRQIFAVEMRHQFVVREPRGMKLCSRRRANLVLPKPR